MRKPYQNVFFQTLKDIAEGFYSLHTHTLPHLRTVTTVLSVIRQRVCVCACVCERLWTSVRPTAITVT